MKYSTTAVLDLAEKIVCNQVSSADAKMASNMLASLVSDRDALESLYDSRKIRIWACVNACEGVPTDVLENTVQRGGALMYQQERRKAAEAQRDIYRSQVEELREECRKIAPLEVLLAKLQITCNARLKAIDVTHNARMRERERAEKAEAQRDELLAALEWAMQKGSIGYTFRNRGNRDHCDKVDEVNALIARAKGGAS